MPEETANQQDTMVSVDQAVTMGGSKSGTLTEPPPTPLDKLKRALDAGSIDQDTYQAAVAGIKAQAAPTAAIAQGQGATALGTRGVVVAGRSDGNINTGQQITAKEGAQIVYAEQGATVIIGDAPVAMTAVDRQSRLGRYLQHLISQNRYLQLQGIRSGGKLVNIELDRIYVTLRATRHPGRRTEVDWLAGQTALAPGEWHRGKDQTAPGDTTQVTVNEALADHQRLVVLGDPGSGKTTLLRYLALLYARDLAEGTQLVSETLGLDESGSLSILLPLRQIGRYLAEHHPKDDGTEGHAILLQFLAQVLKNERIEVPTDFFDAWLTDGRAAVLLDGLDEVADPGLRRRVSRLVDAFTRAYTKCRYVVTSRIVGYNETSRLNEGYATTTVRDFSMEDVTIFLSQWHRLVAIGQMGLGETAEAFAADQTAQLLTAIEKNERVRELAINPLMLTVIALIHRDRVKLPDRRAELYQEAVDVLLGKWDEARGMQESLILNERPFDISDRRLVLQQVALAMHEQAIKEIDAGPLRELLATQLADAVTDPRELDAAVARFLNVIQERTGLLIARAEGTYAFSHLTFQEYLAALAIAGQDDYLDYTLRRCPDAWWRETILLEAGYLSTQSKERTTRLIRAIADARTEPEPYHNLVLAAECVRDAGANRILGDLETELRGRLKQELEAPVSRGRFGALKTLFTRGMSSELATRQRIAAAEALGKIGGSQFWTRPYGEPEWVQIPAGEFTMGEAGEAHRVHMEGYGIARVPITNAQYQLFVLATGYDPPGDWNGTRAPRGREGHPVVNVGLHDALSFCRWLSEATDRPITLPSEAEWEKAARGADDARAYPWGETFDAARCNVDESGFGGTTPVGIFLDGASPYGCLDMAGNVWEWTRSRYEAYPYRPDDDRETPEPKDDDWMVVRGGSWYGRRGRARCAYRGGLRPDRRGGGLGFRVVLRPPPVP
jgi:formylglycine-generating enzyme required for sulfatase activity/energy-coupling factor transporter ATP-binding protein EcfA2